MPGPAGAQCSNSDGRVSKRDTGGAAFDDRPLAWYKPDRPSDCSLRRVCPYRWSSLALVACHAWAQSSHIAVLPPETRALGFLTRPYRQRIVPPINLANSSRLAALNPAPTRHIPVLIGGGGERKTLRIVAQRADIWHGFGDADTIAHKHAVLDGWCAKMGRDPLEIERSAGVSPKSPATSAESLYAVGTRLFTYGVQGPGYDLGPLRDLIAWRDERNRP